MELLTAENLIALFTLAALEIVLGIDNLVFISILSAKLPKEQQPKARRIGLMAALVTRIMLLLAIGWVMQLTEPLFTFLSNEISGRDLILLIGGLFLVGKATLEIHDKIEGTEHEMEGHQKVRSFSGVVLQIGLLDIVFSLDSVITAVGMVDEIWVMVVAVILAMIVMIIFANKIGDFIDRNPTVKMLALSFLVLIGVMLMAEGTGQHIDKGYIYFAMGFSLAVELLNMKVRGTRTSAPAH